MNFFDESSWGSIYRESTLKTLINLHETATKRRGRGRTFIYAQNPVNPSARREENLPESANEIIDIEIPEHLRIERVSRPRAFLYKQSTSTGPATKTEVIEGIVFIYKKKI